MWRYHYRPETGIIQARWPDLRHRETLRRPRYNVSPTQPAPIIKANPCNPDIELHWHRWGIVPPWAKDDRLAAKMGTVRAEDAATHPATRTAYSNGHCLVLCHGWYFLEHMAHGAQPWFLQRPDHGLITLAGLWEAWQPPDLSPAWQTFTILTVPGNISLHGLSDRMPLEVPQRQWEAWLNTRVARSRAISVTGTLGHLVTAASQQHYTRHRVTTRMVSPAFESPLCLMPVTPPCG